MLIFSLELEILNIWGGLYKEYIKTEKNGAFGEELLSENDFEAVLANFCCYDYGANASEAVQKIATDQKDYQGYTYKKTYLAIHFTTGYFFVNLLTKKLRV